MIVRSRNLFRSVRWDARHFTEMFLSPNILSVAPCICGWPGGCQQLCCAAGHRPLTLMLLGTIQRAEQKGWRCFVPWLPMVCSVLGNVKPGLSALENKAVDARAVMHLTAPRDFGAELCSVSCGLGFGNSSASLALQSMAWPPCVIRYWKVFGFSIKLLLVLFG